MLYTKSNNTYFAKPKDDPKDRIEVEIGDSKQPNFEPQFKIMRWDNEVNFSARLVHNEKTPIVSKEGEKIKWVGDKVEVNTYALTEGEGGHEFEVILKEKPKTNVVQFTLQTKGLDFFYQPELTQEEKYQGLERPENVIGSYAVYASENKINYVGGKEYKCGKVGHIFRPKIVDSAGVEVWGEMNIDIKKGILSVIIPQDFLNKAVYPIRHAAGLTFGYNGTGAGGGTQGSSYCGLAAVYTHTATTGDTVTKISVQAKITSGTHAVGMAIYSISGGYPSARLGDATDVTVGTTKQWYDSSTLSLSMLNGVSYGAAMTDYNGYAVTFYYDTGGTTGSFARSSNLSLPSTWVGTVTTTTRFMLYATYTEGGGGAAVQPPQMNLLGVG